MNQENGRQRLKISRKCNKEDVMGDSLHDNIKWIISSDKSSVNDVAAKFPEPKYSVFGERIRHVAPSSMQCSLFCGGKQCKYCNPIKFKKEPGQDAISGLYSAWVTKDILATSRPSTYAINEYGIIEQFKSNGIKAIINLQHPGEHSACGFGLEDGGFSYVPQHFMDNGVFFYNFGWNDYGVRSLQSILDMVKVFDFAIANGKAAVHCHAGLGRTGVLIACYLIYSTRMTSHEAILQVREARPKAIQTRGQINCVNDFESYIKPMWIVFPENNECFSLKCLMNRQRSLLHGEEARTLRFLPKIVFVICQRLLNHAEVEFDLSQSAITTHFSFMINSSFRGAKDSEDNNSEGERKKSDSEIFNNMEYVKNEETLRLRRHSGETYLNQQRSNFKNETEDDSRKLDNQHKASSTPNVSLTNLREPYKIDKPPTAGNGRIFLEPIETTKNKKRKKKRSLHERVMDIQNGGYTVESEKSLMTKSEHLRPDDTEDEVSLNSSLASATLNEKFRKLSSSKTDSISLASFSSTANEGLSRNDLVLKHLAFRSSDITISTRIERYKKKLNSIESAWDTLSQESNFGVLSGLLWGWLSQLESPILSCNDIAVLKECVEIPEEASGNIDKDIWKLMKFFLIFLSKLDGKNEFLVRILRRFSIVLTNTDLPHDVIEAGYNCDENSTECESVIVFRFLRIWVTRLKD